MGDQIVVRDHGQPCEHGSLWSHWVNVRDARWWHEPECVGGKEMVLRRLANGDWRDVTEGQHRDGGPEVSPGTADR